MRKGRSTGGVRSARGRGRNFRCGRSFSIGIAKILFFVGLALVVLFLILGSAAAKKIT